MSSRRISDQYDIRQGRNQWCYDNIGDFGEGWRLDYDFIIGGVAFIYSFKTEEDAIMFKLKFG